MKIILQQIKEKRKGHCFGAASFCNWKQSQLLQQEQKLVTTNRTRAVLFNWATQLELEPISTTTTNAIFCNLSQRCFLLLYPNWNLSQILLPHPSQVSSPVTKNRIGANYCT
jgi:hypothetical protein